MRFHDRGEAVELAPQSWEPFRGSRLRLAGQAPYLGQDRGYRGVVLHQLPDRGRKVWPGIPQRREHAVVLAQVMRCQGRAERQAVNLKVPLWVLPVAESFADPGELVSQVLMGLPQLPAERRGPLMVMGNHEGVVPSFPASMPDAVRHRHATMPHFTTAPPRTLSRRPADRGRAAMAVSGREG